MTSIVSRMKSDLYNGDDDPEKGLVPEIRAWLVEERYVRRKKTERAKLFRDLFLYCGVPVLCVLLATGIPGCVKLAAFFNQLSNIAQEWDQIHHSEIPPHKSFWQHPETGISSNQKPQSATLPSDYPRN